MKWLFSLLLILLMFGGMFTPDAAMAQNDFVPCEGPDCTACHLLDMIETIIFWLATTFTIIAIGIVMYAGFKLATSGGNMTAKDAAKELLINGMIGLVIILSAWFIVDTVIKILLVDNEEISYGMWNEINCDKHPPIEDPLSVRFDTPGRVTASGANATQLSPADVAASVASIRNAGETADMARQAALEAGMTEEQADYYVALVQQESTMCQNKVGPQTRYGRAYGCSQMLLSTARGLDSGATADRLTNDDAYSLTLGAQYFRSRLEMYGGDTRRALAAYNGGTKANEQSNTCPGQMVWECAANDGYAETRNYVGNIDAMVAQGF